MGATAAPARTAAQQGLERREHLRAVPSCRRLRALAPGAAITIRQLNNQRPVERFLEPWFAFDEPFARGLLAADRSLFYERILVGFRT